MPVQVRFPRQPLAGRDNPPEWLAFVWAVNEVLPETFGEPAHQQDTPFPGYLTERYENARIIWAPGDEGIRVVADTTAVAEAFATAGQALGIHVAPAEA